MNGSDFIDHVSRRMNQEGTNSVTDTKIAKRLGMSNQSLINWRKRKDISPLQVAKLLERVELQAKKNAQREAIVPIVEFFEIEHKYSDRSDRCQILDTSDYDEGEHPYKAGVKNALNSNHGVYIFYDSRGRGLYVGQAKTQTLWNEMNSAFNRERQVQKVRKTSHPTTRKDFRSYDEIRRQIQDRNIVLSEMAYYFSAYIVSIGMIANLEALLVRGFANDILNKKMENFRL